MEEHFLQSSIGINVVTEFMVAAGGGTHPRRHRPPKPLRLSQSRPAIVCVHHQPAPWTDDAARVSQHFATLRTPLDHPQRAEQADARIRGVLGQASQLDQVRSNRLDRPRQVTRIRRRIDCPTGSTIQFSQQTFQHRLAQVDADDAVTSLAEQQSCTSGTAPQVKNHRMRWIILLRSRVAFPHGEPLFQKLPIEFAKRRICHKAVVMVGDLPLVSVGPRSG